MFLIPYNKLSDNQKRIIQRISREKSNLFVEGPPGSGKTLISLHYVKDLSNDNVTKPLVLLYNKSLYGYLRKSFEELEITDNITLETKDKFFWDLAKKYNIKPSGNDYEVKYNKLLTDLCNTQIEEKWSVAVIDEVQDLNKLEWAVLKKIATKITSMGDFNQSVYQSDLTRADVVSIGVFEKLFDIFRFHSGIAKIAQLFSKNKESLDQNVTRVEAEDVQIVETTNDYDEAVKVKEIVASLLRKDGRIGLICPGHVRQDIMHQKLDELKVAHTYYSSNGSFKDHDFADKKPLLITSASSKGLEFDHVIVYGFDGDDPAVMQYRFTSKLQEIIYVSITRANSGLFILKNPRSISEIQNLVVELTTNNEEVTIDDIFG